MGHHEEIDVIVTGGQQNASFEIPGEVRQLLKFGSPVELRSSIKDLLRTNIDDLVNQEFAERRQKLNEEMQAFKKKLLEAFDRIKDST